jgi:hypothetical protein
MLPGTGLQAMGLQIPSMLPIMCRTHPKKREVLTPVSADTYTYLLYRFVKNTSIENSAARPDGLFPNRCRFDLSPVFLYDEGYRTQLWLIEISKEREHK